MLDDHHRHRIARAQSRQYLGQLARLRGGDPRRGLIEQHQLGFERNGAHQLRQPTGAGGQRPDGGLGELTQPERVDELHGRLATARVAPVRPRDRLEDGRGLLAFPGHHHGVEETQRREEHRRLEGTGHSGATAGVGGQRRDVDTVEEHRPTVGPHEAGQELEQGGLAGTVGADEADNLAPRDRQVHPVDRSHRPVALHQSAGRQQRSVSDGHRTRRHTWIRGSRRGGEDRGVVGHLVERVGRRHHPVGIRLETHRPREQVLHTGP